VQAGRAGGFGLESGIGRRGQAPDLRNNGADVVVQDVADLHVRLRPEASCHAVHAVPRALDHYAAI
jgi:hypothetical protein